MKKEQDEKQLNETLRKIQQDREDQNKIYDEIDKKTSLLRQGMAAGTAVERAKNEIKESTKLKELYASIEELNADFSARIQRMDAAAETMKQQMNAGFAAKADMLYSSGSTIDNGFNAASKLIGGYISNAKAEKEREKAALELERKKKLAEANMEIERKKMLAALRNELFHKFPKTAIPVASSKIQENVIYFFIYAFDSTRITEKQAVMHISNVFPLVRYNDGTWPLKSVIEKEINALSPLPKTLHGYYASREEAEAMQNAMKDIYTKTGGNIQSLQYKGRPGFATGSEDTDFWGNKKKDPNAKKIPATSDFWNQ
ncbi:MAG: hypothetical protein K2X37_02240 [Chitinophagaceae bacterium]|nr:hypothetical protein [Chitinophagaceae bacterium]